MCPECYEKHALYEYIISRSCPNTSKAVARAQWGDITSTLRGLSRFPSVYLSPWCQMMLQHPAELQRKTAWGGQRSKYTKYQYWNSHVNTHQDKRLTCSELNGLCLTCYSVICMICTSVLTLCASGLMPYVLHYTRWDGIYNQTELNCFTATVK